MKAQIKEVRREEDSLRGEDLQENGGKQKEEVENEVLSIPVATSTTTFKL